MACKVLVIIISGCILLLITLLSQGVQNSKSEHGGHLIIFIKTSKGYNSLLSHLIVVTLVVSCCFLAMTGIGDVLATI